jgi:hypothetical protein
MTGIELDWLVYPSRLEWEPYLGGVKLVEDTLRWWQSVEVL